VSDGDHKDYEDPYNERRLLLDNGVNIFTVGVGTWLRTSVMRHLASIPAYYDQRKSWEQLLHRQPTNLRPGTENRQTQCDGSVLECGVEEA